MLTQIKLERSSFNKIGEIIKIVCIRGCKTIGVVSSDVAAKIIVNYQEKMTISEILQMENGQCACFSTSQDLGSIEVISISRLSRTLRGSRFALRGSLGWASATRRKGGKGDCPK